MQFSKVNGFVRRMLCQDTWFLTLGIVTADTKQKTAATKHPSVNVFKTSPLRFL